MGPYEGEPNDATFQERLFFGGPDTVIEKFRGAAALGATHISNWMMFGGIEHKRVMRSIKLMGEEVIPALRGREPAGRAVRRAGGGAAGDGGGVAGDTVGAGAVGRGAVGGRRGAGSLGSSASP